MAWSVSTPTTTTKVKDSPAIFQGNWAALEAALVTEHLGMAGSVPAQHRAGKCAVMMYGTQAAITAITSTTACAVALDTDRLDLCYNNGSVWASAGGLIPVGTKMLFYQDTAPTGWTIQDTLDDKLVFITKGSAAGGQTGGGAHSTGSWTISGFVGHTHTGPSHTHQTPDGGWTLGDASASGTQLLLSTSTYNHPTGSIPTGAGGTEATGSTAGTQDGTWRPAAYCCIICTKN